LLPPYAYMFIPAGWLTFDRAGLHLLNCTSLAWRTVCFAQQRGRFVNESLHLSSGRSVGLGKIGVLGKREVRKTGRTRVALQAWRPDSPDRSGCKEIGQIGSQWIPDGTGSDASRRRMHHWGIPTLSAPKGQGQVFGLLALSSYQPSSISLIHIIPYPVLVVKRIRRK